MFVTIQRETGCSLSRNTRRRTLGTAHMGPVPESKPGYWGQMRQSLVGRKLEDVGGDELLR